MSALGAREIARLAHDAGFRGKSLDTAVAVALAESAGRPRIRGDVGLQDGTWGPSVGLWQIRSLRADRGTGRTRDELANLDPATNAKHAFRVSSGGRSFQPWTMYTNGGYRQFLGRAHAAALALRADRRDGGGGDDRPGRDDHDGRRRGGGGDDGRRAGRRTGGHGRIVMDLAELAAFDRLLGHSVDRVTHTGRIVRDVRADLAELAPTLPDPADAAFLLTLADQVDGAEGLETVARHLAFTQGLAHRTRELALAADGPDGRYTRRDAIAFLRKAGPSIDLPETAVLEALILGGLRVHHRGRAVPVGTARPGRARVPTPTSVTGGTPAPSAPRHYRNGHLPTGALRPVGDGERLARPAARPFRRMDAAARRDGVTLHVNSGYRTYAEQAGLYARYRAGTGNLAAPPGHSTHGAGLSVDLQVSDPATLRWLRTHAGRYGFVNDVPSEPWHWTRRPT